MHLLVKVCSTLLLAGTIVGARHTPQRSCTHNDLKASDADASDAYLTYHPHYNTQFVGCDSILSLTPQARTWHVFETSALGLGRLDPRWDGMHLRFEWDPTGQGEFSHRVMGLKEFTLSDAQATLQTVDVSDKLELEAFICEDQNSAAYGERFQPVFFRDLNMDSYLDLWFVSGGGKANMPAVYLYNPKTRSFNYSQDYRAPEVLTCNCTGNWVQLRQVAGSAYDYPTEFLKLQNGHPTPWLRTYQEITQQEGHMRGGLLRVVEESTSRSDSLLGCQWDSAPDFEVLSNPEGKSYLLSECFYYRAGTTEGTLRVFGLEASDGFMTPLADAFYTLEQTAYDGEIDGVLHGHESLVELEWEMGVDALIVKVDSTVYRFSEKEGDDGRFEGRYQRVDRIPFER